MEIIFDLDNIKEAAEKFLENIGADRLFAFEGEMGAGKTTFISEICRLSGVKDDVGSPTFSIVNEYSDREGRPIYHFDFYRIENLQEAMDIGLEDYLESGNLCFMEWSGNVAPLLPSDVRQVEIKEHADGKRVLRF